MRRLLLLAIAIGSTAGTVDCWLKPLEPPLRCSEFSVVLRPGSCRLIRNPCGEEWLSQGSSTVEAFELVFPSPFVYLKKTVAADQTTTFSICANPSAIGRSEDTGFHYARSGSWGKVFGEGQLGISIQPEIVIVATAHPDQIPAGLSSILFANVSGGIPPYSYSWSPSSGLEASNVASARATPATTTTYTVHVTDSVGVSAEADVTVTVRVGSPLLVEASPATVNPGDRSQLDVTPSHGMPPYSYLWSPREGLSPDPREGDPTLQRPVAIVTTNTTFSVTATDATGASQSGSVEVRVFLSTELAAAPSSIPAGGSSQLDAGPAGGDGRYTYAWSPAAGLSDPAIRNPIASPNTTTDYTVTVTDGQGFQASGQVTVTVAAVPALSASFEFVRGALDPVARTIHWTFDGSLSTGNIVSFTWDSIGNDASTTHNVTTGPVLEIDLPETAQRGLMTLRVMAADGTTASLQRSYR